MERIDRDRHDLVKDLIKSGLTENQSEIIGEAFFGNNNLATKNDLKFAVLELKTDITVIQQTMATKSDIIGIKNEMVTEFGKIKESMIGFSLAIMALLVPIIGIGVSLLIK